MRMGVDSSRFNPGAASEAIGAIANHLNTSNKSEFGHMQNRLKATATANKASENKIDSAHVAAIHEDRARTGASLSARQNEPVADVNARIRANLGKETLRNRALADAAGRAMGHADGASFLTNTSAPTPTSGATRPSGPMGNRR